MPAPRDARQTTVIARSMPRACRMGSTTWQSASKQDLSSIQPAVSLLLVCPVIVRLRRGNQSSKTAGIPGPTDKSSQSGFIDSIKASFRFRFQLLICFSRSSADQTSFVVSYQTSEPSLWRLVNDEPLPDRCSTNLLIKLLVTPVYTVRLVFDRMYTQ